MTKPLSALIVEDSEDDAELLAYELISSGYDLKYMRVQTEADFLKELKKNPDIVLSDYSLPQFNGLRAAQLTQENSPQIPFILISGTVGEEVAVEAMKSGATDYLLKDRLARLGRAVERALLEAGKHARFKEAEQSLKLFRTLVDKSSDGIEVVDPETGKFLDVNETMCRRLGYSREELLSMQVWEIDPQVKQANWPQMANDLRQKKSLAVQGNHQRKDRTLFPVEVNLTWVQLEREYIVNVVRDITERRRLEVQFLQSQKMESIGQLAGGVAHDFNNILAIIQMQSELLKDQADLTSEQCEFADEILDSVRRASALTRQLLLFSRREVLQPRMLDLNESVGSTTRMLQRILGETIQMEIKLSPRPVLVHADPGMIDQVLMNLSVNARDAMPEGGRLIIETSEAELDELAVAQTLHARPGSFVCLSVTDSGSGIAPEILPKIFEPFFTTKGVGKGTGLGLATVFGIVQQHQGWVNVYSEVGHGTTFRIYLPRLVKKTASKSDLPALEKICGGNETVLLVEDDSSLRTSIEKALTQLGYHVFEAATGPNAIEVWKANCRQIDLLLTDLVMPGGITGKGLAEMILRDNSAMKIIYMSGYSVEIAGKDFPLQEGVNFLTKPFQVTKLAETVRTCLDRKRPA
jgi:two-component system cell cycle sensor histidine kinase/response regulator CckA